MRLLEEKETSAEEKEQRKLEREEKKKKKEEEKKQKAEARVLKAAEREQGVKGRRGPKRKAPSRQDDSVNNDDAENEYLDEHDSRALPVRKKVQVVNEHAQEMSTIDTNQCCVCFSHYQDDVAEANGKNWS